MHVVGDRSAYAMMVSSIRDRLHETREAEDDLWKVPLGAPAAQMSNGRHCTVGLSDMVCPSLQVLMGCSGMSAHHLLSEQRLVQEYD